MYRLFAHAIFRQLTSILLTTISTTKNHNTQKNWKPKLKPLDCNSIHLLGFWIKTYLFTVFFIPFIIIRVGWKEDTPIFYTSHIQIQIKCTKCKKLITQPWLRSSPCSPICHRTWRRSRHADACGHSGPECSWSPCHISGTSPAWAPRTWKSSLPGPCRPHEGLGQPARGCKRFPTAQP